MRRGVIYTPLSDDPSPSHSTYRSVNDLITQLRAQFGLTAFRPGQEAVMRAVLAGRDVMTVMPTGQGKSLCYQLPATLLPGLTLVLSPLIALMQDQVASLTQRGVHAAAFHSGLTGPAKHRVMQDLQQQRLQLLYLAPERMQHEAFLQHLRAVWVSLLVVDEAHCISHWGHDFRPDYLKIGRLRQDLTNPPCLALTATATTRVQLDLCTRLALRDPFTLVMGFRRPNLALSVRLCASREEKRATLAQLVRTREQGTGLIYCATRRAVEEVAAWLGQTQASVGAYHAGLSDDERQRVHHDFRRGTVKILVATNAFGMGIDKSDVRLVVHFDIPGSVEAYYQEVGRAGRDGRPAACVLLFHERDLATQEYFIHLAAQDPDGADRAARMRTLLHEMRGYVSTSTCRQLAILEYFSDDAGRAVGPCGLCDRCVAPMPHARPAVSDEESASATAVLATVSWCGGRVGVSRIVEVLRGSRATALLAFGGDRCPTYGICRAHSKASVTHLVKGLIESGYLQVDGVEYPTIDVTSHGRAVLQGAGPVSLNVVEARPRKAPAPPRARAPSGPVAARSLGPVDPHVLDQLKQLRTELAEDEAVAPSVIFPDKTLKALARHLPTTPAALLDVPGIGALQAERYGRRVLAVVNGAR